MSKVKSIPRRTFLRGLGGVSVALPLLEIMRPSMASAQTVPKRFVYMFQGQSLGADSQYANFFIPPTTGNNYTVSVSLNSTTQHGVRNDMTVVSGLLIPTTGMGSRDPAFHAIAHFPQLLGARALSYNGARGEGADQIVARQIGTGTKFQSLSFLGQPYEYHDITADGQRNVCSYVRNSAGRIVAVFPEVSPLRAFNSLFGTGSGGGGTTAPDPLIARRKSVLDFVLASRDTLLRDLGASDASRLNDHFDQIRTLERSLAAQAPVIGGACTSPVRPGADPALSLATSSGETIRNRTFMDIIHLALVCDLTRVVNHMFTQAQCFLSTREVGGALSNVNTDVHELGHFGGQSLPTPPAGTPFLSMPGGNGSLSNSRNCYAMALAHSWAVNNFAYLVSKLKSTPEGDGTVLDNTVLLMGFEGGHGGETDDGFVHGSHSTQNMAMLIAGGAGGLKHGRHLAMPGVHPARVTISAMTAVGGPSTLGEVSGSLPALFAS